MKKIIFTSAIILGMTFGVHAQVGIGTTAPTSGIDVNGTVRVTSLPVGTTAEISPTGSTSNKTLNRTDLGANLIVMDNSLETAPVSGTIGNFNLGDAPVSGGTIGNLDLEIGSGGSNSGATFIKLHTYFTNVDIAGIQDGVDGRHLTLFFSETTNVNILEDDSDALAQNRILTAANSQLSIGGLGFMDLVYDADAGSDGLGRWLVIKFRG